MQGTQKLFNGSGVEQVAQAVISIPSPQCAKGETGDREERRVPQQWYAIYAKPHREEIAQFHLQRKGLQTFFPKLRLPGSQRHRQHIVPLFPNYLFALFRVPEEYNLVRWSPGVKQVVSCNNVPIPLEDTIMDFLRHKATADDILVAQSNLAVGSGVRIVRGPFEGLIGIIENPPDARGRVKVLMQLLSREVRVDIPVDSLDGGWRMASGG